MIEFSLVKYEQSQENMEGEVASQKPKEKDFMDDSSLLLTPLIEQDKQFQTLEEKPFF